MHATSTPSYADHPNMGLRDLLTVAKVRSAQPWYTALVPAGTSAPLSTIINSEMSSHQLLDLSNILARVALTKAQEESL